MRRKPESRLCYVRLCSALWLAACVEEAGMPAHSWQATACAGSSIGIKGMMVVK
jgi:hypothetical protein